MIDQVSSPNAPPSPRDINPDHKEPKNWGVKVIELGPHPMFVDDTIMAEVRSLLFRSDENSVLTASVFIGNSDLVEEPINVEIFEFFFTHLN